MRRLTGITLGDVSLPTSTRNLSRHLLSQLATPRRAIEVLLFLGDKSAPTHKGQEG